MAFEKCPTCGGMFASLKRHFCMGGNRRAADSSLRAEGPTSSDASPKGKQLAMASGLRPPGASEAIALAGAATGGNVTRSFRVRIPGGAPSSAEKSETPSSPDPRGGLATVRSLPMAGEVEGGGSGMRPGSAEAKPKRGRPLKRDADKSFERTKPWEAEGMARSTWYGRRRAKK